MGRLIATLLAALLLLAPASAGWCFQPCLPQPEHACCNNHPLYAPVSHPAAADAMAARTASDRPCCPAILPSRNPAGTGHLAGLALHTHGNAVAAEYGSRLCASPAAVPLCAGPTALRALRPARADDGPLRLLSTPALLQIALLVHLRVASLVGGAGTAPPKPILLPLRI